MPKREPVRWQQLLVLCFGFLLCLRVAESVEVEELLPGKGEVLAQASASGGKPVKFNLEGVRAGPIVTIPLPGEPRAGKYVVVLRVRMDPVDACSDSFTLSAGSSSRTFMGTTNPDRQDSDYRLWVLPFVYDGEGDFALTVTLGRPAHFAHQTTRALLLDRLDVRDIGGVYIESIRTNKVLYDPGEQIRCEVAVCNVGLTPGLAPQSPAGFEVRALEQLGLNESREVARGRTDEEGRVVLKWNAGEEEYGRRVTVELLDGERVLDSASEFYNVADNVWKVAMQARLWGLHMTDPRSKYCGAKTDEQLRQSVYDARAGYGNFKEQFAWAPDDVYYMTPTEEYWISGQGTYQHKRSRLLLQNQLLLENGIWPITYAKSAASGPPAFEFHRRNPRFGVGHLQCQFDQEYVRNWDKQTPGEGEEDTCFYTWLSVVVNITIPELVDICINEILDSAEMFGWRGARYDDHYTYWGRRDHELSTRNMERIFEIGRERNPGFVWGFNYLAHWVPFAYHGQKYEGAPWKQRHKDPELLPDPLPTWKELPEVPGEFVVACKNGGYIMNEEARGAWSEGEWRRTYTNYARLLTHEARLVRALGGHYGPIPFDPQPRSAFDAIFPDILRGASRSHTYGQIRGGVDMLRFMTRYSAFVYGTALEPIMDPEPLLTVSADPGVWWHNYCYFFGDGPDRKVVVHLLSVPRNDKIGENLDGEVSKVHDVSVTYTGSESVGNAYELSPFIEGFCREIPVNGKAARPSDFYLWTVVVLELGD